MRRYVTLKAFCYVLGEVNKINYISTGRKFNMVGNAYSKISLRMSVRVKIKKKIKSTVSASTFLLLATPNMEK